MDSSRRELIERLEMTIDHKYRDRGLLMTALTHSSYSNEHRSEGIQCNERSEFLGDSVLSLIVSQYLFENFRMQEGELSKLRSAVVCEQSLHVCAGNIGLGEYLRLGHGEENSNGRARPSILADAFEALIASVYLDGGFEEARRVFLPMLLPQIEKAAHGKMNRDYKTVLQEIVQQNPEEQLSYVLVGESGPDHNKSFTVEVHLNSNVIASGTGHSKKEAEQAAARSALALMGEE